MKQFIIAIGLCAALSSNVYCVLTVSSPKFKHGEFINCLYSCNGDNISPPISWTRGPENTVSYVLICDDPDAHGGTWVHWIVYNIPVEMTSLPERFGRVGKTDLGQGIKQGKNSFKRFDYGGPCPPSGTHQYFFRVYAVDRMLDFGPKKEIKVNDVLDAIKGNVPGKSHTLDQGKLMVQYAQVKPCPKKALEDRSS